MAEGKKKIEEWTQVWIFCMYYSKHRLYSQYYLGLVGIKYNNSFKVHNNPGLYPVKGKYSSLINAVLEHCELQHSTKKILKRAFSSKIITILTKRICVHILISEFGPVFSWTSLRNHINEVLYKHKISNLSEAIH